MTKNKTQITSSEEAHINNTIVEASENQLKARDNLKEAIDILRSNSNLINQIDSSKHQDNLEIIDCLEEIDLFIIDAIALMEDSSAIVHNMNRIIGTIAQGRDLVADPAEVDARMKDLTFYLFCNGFRTKASENEARFKNGKLKKNYECHLSDGTVYTCENMKIDLVNTTGMSKKKKEHVRKLLLNGSKQTRFQGP